MARGWESKSVEQQQDEAASERGRNRVQMTPAEIAEEQRRRGLELSRQRILQQLAVASNSRHREMLEAALAELEARMVEKNLGG
jgi:signal recognition particle GTPase